MFQPPANDINGEGKWRISLNSIVLLVVMTALFRKPMTMMNKTVNDQQYASPVASRNEITSSDDVNDDMKADDGDRPPLRLQNRTWRMEEHYTPIQ